LQFAFAQRILRPLTFCDVTSGSEHTLHFSRLVLEHGGVVEHLRDLPRRAPDGERIVVHKALGENFLVTAPCPLWFGEIIAKIAADQALASNSGGFLRSIIHVRNASARPRISRTLSRDNTERKRTEEALQSAHQLDIVELLPDATLVIDKDGRVIAWNRAIEQMTGKSWSFS